MVKYVEFNVHGPLLTAPLGSRPTTKATHMVVNAAVVDDSHRLYNIIIESMITFCGFEALNIVGHKLHFCRS